jgi:hypothetical protein
MFRHKDININSKVQNLCQLKLKLNNLRERDYSKKNVEIHFITT